MDPGWLAAAAAILAGIVAVLVVLRRSRRERTRMAETAEALGTELHGRVRDLEEQRASLEAVLASMDEGVVVLGRDEDPVYANGSAERILGRGSEGPPLPPRLRRLVSEVAGGRGTRIEEVEVPLPPMIVSARAMRLPDGERVLLVLRDVTAGKRVEAMRRDFVADASHELKTPAASIQAAAETVLRATTDDPEAVERFATQLARDARRLSRIVSDLLDLSRLESESPIFEPIRFDMVVAEEVAKIRAEAEERGVRVGIDVDPVTVEGSRKDLALLVRNLMDNAVRYTPSGGDVRVGVDVIDGMARFLIADNGIGIPRRDLPRIFERFYRVDRARSRETGGTGLGLSIARHVVEQHGGTIHAESELGAGSTFRVELPATADGR